MRGLQIGAGFRDYILVQEGLQIGAALAILKWGDGGGRGEITNRGRDFKLGQRDFKSGQRLQIGSREISNWGRDYKLVQNIGTSTQQFSQ